MQLSERQNDALTELINIAFSRTAASLSELTGHRVLLDVPKVAIYPVSELSARLAEFLPAELASVHQVFTGPLTGDALLLLDYNGAVMLTDLLTEESAHSQKLNESAREVLTEVGNILLNACLGMFGNLLQVRISFSVPRLHLETLGSMVKSLVIDKEELRYALVVYTAFHVRHSAINGFLVIALSVVSLDRLIHEVEKWEYNQENQ
ncbi:MAG TPA: chemotaxis protein CheC [Blastocatellia bacterium]|nr:chemotaxis protein CheC [Blastocatellia bacterium]